PLLGGLDAESDGEVSLSGADRAGEDHVFGSRDPLATGELGDDGGREGTDGRGEVESIESLHVREARVVKAMTDGGFSTRGFFGGEDVVEVVLVAPVLLTSLASERLEGASEAGH